MNPGKEFEKDFERSVPSSAYCYKIPDPVFASEKGRACSGATRFAPKPPYDLVLCSNGRMIALELKSTAQRKMSYGESRGHAIKKKQLEELLKVERSGGCAGFVLNFRKAEETYFVSASEAEGFFSMGSKSISKEQASEIGILVEQKLKKTRYGYGVFKLLTALGV